MLQLLAALVAGLAWGTREPGLSRRSLLAASTLGPFAACPESRAAEAEAVDAVVLVSQLSLQARDLQLYVRMQAAEQRASGSANFETLRSKVEKARAPLLGRLLAAMQTAAPGLRLCSPETAACDCSPDPELVREAARQVEAVRMHLAELDAAAASSRAFELLTLKGGAVVYGGGAVERELEEISEAADAFLDLAAGRPLMTARVAPLSAATALARPPPIRPSIGTPRAALRQSIHMSIHMSKSSATGTTAGMTTGVSGVDDERRRPSEIVEMASEPTPPLAERLFAEELNLVYDSKCGVCQWEVDFLRSRDRDGKLMYTDLEGDDFEEGAARNGYLDYEAALASFHAIRYDGEVHIHTYVHAHVLRACIHMRQRSPLSMLCAPMARCSAACVSLVRADPLSALSD